VKIRVIEPWEHFWKQIFDYITINDLPEYDVLFYIVLSPSVYHRRDKKLAKFLDKIAKMYNVPNDKAYVAPMVYAMSVYELYYMHGRLPKKNSEGLEYLYKSIMSDYRKCDVEYTFEDVIDADDDVAASTMQPRQWYILHCALNDEEADNVAELMEKTIKEEETSKMNNSEDHIIVDEFLSNSEKEKEMDETINKFTVNGMPSYNEMAQFLGGKMVNNKFVAAKKLVKLYYALLLKYEHMQEIIHKYKQNMDALAEKYDELHELYIGDTRQLLEENDYLIEQLNEAKNQKRIVYVDNADKYEAEIQSVEAEYKKTTELLKRELESWKEIAETVLQENTQEVQITPLDKLTQVAYFALDDPQLDAYMFQYNVELKHYSPITPPRHVPNIPIVFNIDVASHKVWNKISYAKPLIIKGTNNDIIAAKIITWLKGADYDSGKNNQSIG
jgi:hypothetical protein